MICRILDILLSFFRIFFEGGAQNSSLPPGARYPRYATEWGPSFIEGLFRLAPLTKNSVGVHGREQTRCGYCTKATQIHGALIVIFVYALQKPETAT